MSKHVSVVIPTKNEERNLELCLASLNGRFTTFVVDSESTDATPSIARRYGAELVHFDWNGEFPKKRNWFLRTKKIETPWVLFLDADERLTDGFADELERRLPRTRHVGFWVRYSNRFMGRRLRFGIPMRKLSLFKTGAGEYENIDEKRWTHLDMEIHEHPVLAGSVGDFGSKITHDDQNPLEKWIARHNDYSTWEATRIVDHGVEGKTFRQRLKYQAISSPLFPAAYFGAQYFGYLGFLDGRAGFQFAFAKSIYFATVREKVRERRRRS